MNRNIIDIQQLTDAIPPEVDYIFTATKESYHYHCTVEIKHPLPIRLKESSNALDTAFETLVIELKRKIRC